MHEDLYILSDQVFGWDSDYRVLREAGVEAVRAHPGDLRLGRARHGLGRARQGAVPIRRVGRRADTRRSRDQRADFLRRPRASRSRRVRSSGSRVPTRASGRCGRRRPTGTSSSTTPRSAPGSSEIQRETGALFDALPGPRGQRAARAPPQPALALVPAAVDVDRRSGSSASRCDDREARRRSSPWRWRPRRRPPERPRALRRPPLRAPRRAGVRSARRGWSARGRPPATV